MEESVNKKLPKRPNLDHFAVRRRLFSPIFTAATPKPPAPSSNIFPRRRR